MPMAPVKKKANSVSTADAMLLSQQYLRRRFFLLARTRWGRSTCRYFSLPVMMPAPGGSAPANCPAGGSNKAETRTIEAPSGADANHIRICCCCTPEVVQRKKKNDLGYLVPRPCIPPPLYSPWKRVPPSPDESQSTLCTSPPRG